MSDKYYNVWMQDCGPNKGRVISISHELARFICGQSEGLIDEIRDFVEHTPAMMFNNLSLETAQEVCQFLESVGAQLDIRPTMEDYVQIH